MTITLKQVVALPNITIEETTILEWIERDWIRPLQANGQYLFEEIDVTRIQLVIDLHFRMGVGENSLSLVLSLLDQLYGTRTRMAELYAAISKQPLDVQRDILDLISRKPDTD